MPSNECIPFYEDGDDITGYANVNVTGKKFVDIVGNRQNDITAVSDSVAGGNITVGLPAAGGMTFGVAAYDQVAGKLVPIKRGRGYVLPVTAAAAINAGQEVQVDATGAVIPLAAGRAVGRALANCASGADAQISLY